MTQPANKRFYVLVLALATVLLTVLMVQLVEMVVGSAVFESWLPSQVELPIFYTTGVVLLLILIIFYLYRIFREYRQRVPGTQLAMRILRNIALITLFSIVVVYVFSFLALSRGIDNWFELQVGQAVEQAKQLRVIVFDSFETRIRNDFNPVVEELATLLRHQGDRKIVAAINASNADDQSNNGRPLGEVEPSRQDGGLSIDGAPFSDLIRTDGSDNESSVRDSIFRLIFDASQSADYEEVTYFADLASPESVVISSSSRTGSLLPVQPSQRLIEQLFLDPENRQFLDVTEGQNESNRPWPGRQSSWELLHDDSGATLLRMLIPVPIAGQTQRHYLQVLTKLPLSSQRLAERISQMNDRQERLEYLRNPLKVSFILALTFVTLVVILLATWAAIGLTRQLVQPIRTLSAGTKAVAKGRYEKLDDANIENEFGELVQSFNDMISRIKESQEKISQSQTMAEQHSAYLEIVLKHLSAGVLFMDRDEKLTSINLATENILQISAEDVKFTQLRDLAKFGKVYSPLFASIARSIDRGDSDWSDTVRLETTLGEQVLAYSVTELPVPDSASVNHVVVIEDITALAQVQRVVAWREVARRMAHEMLNPLQPIQLAVDRIQYKIDEHLSTEQKQSLELSFAAISRQLNTLHRIVKEFQDYSKPIELRPVTLHLNELIREVFASQEKNEQIESVELDLDTTLPPMYGDPDKLVQVFNNLIKNAKEAAPESGKIVLQVKSRLNDDGDVVIWVRDNGPGFENDVFDRIFEPYATTKKQGMGFGLEIVKRIVEAHGGTVSARNRSSGVGAEIQLKFVVGMESALGMSEVLNFNEYRQEA